MTEKIIDLKAERDRRDGPDAEHIYVDEKGVKWFKYLIDYSIDDATFGFQLWATSFEDAERRLTAIRGSAHVEGCLHSVIPA